MNHLIQRLIEEATTQEAYYPAGCNGYPEYRSEFDKEKFAELIVKECLTLADEFELYINQAGMVDMIKTHFGVKE
jgi:hypothetical protein